MVKRQKAIIPNFFLSRKSGEEKAERVVQAELKRRRWTESDLVARRKGDRAKIVMAVRLRRETPVIARWIAERLQMGSTDYTQQLLYKSVSMS